MKLCGNDNDFMYMRNLRNIVRMAVLSFLLMIAASLHAQSRRVNEIHLEGNKWTRASIILRELTVKQGDYLTDEQLEEAMTDCKENLLNTSLFNYVYINAKYLEIDSALVNISVKVEERWYIWPIFELNLEDRNISSWIRNPSWEKTTVMIGTTIYNMRGMNETWRIFGKWGYKRAINSSYQNIALDRERKHILGLSFVYETQRNIAYVTANNEVQYATAEDGPIREYVLFGINYTYRPRVREYHSVRMSYSNIRLNDTLLQLNPSYWGSSETKRNFFRANYTYRIDYRDSYIYPLHGNMFSIRADADMALDGESYRLTFYPEYQFHTRLASRWGYACALSSKLSPFTTNTYTYNQALGYDNRWLRGYEYYVADGQYYALLQNNLKFTLLPTKVVTINFLSSLSKFNKIHFTFYLNAFLDAGYAYNRYKTFDNSLQNNFLYSGGIGFDIVTYYDITLRIDYSVNKMGERGIYFHIKSPFR